MRPRSSFLQGLQLFPAIIMYAIFPQFFLQHQRLCSLSQWCTMLHVQLQILRRKVTRSLRLLILIAVSTAHINRALRRFPLCPRQYLTDCTETTMDIAKLQKVRHNLCCFYDDAALGESLVPVRF
jgi:hypothetical protein